MKSVNKAVRKKDAMELLLGKPVYTDDIAPKDCLVLMLLTYALAYGERRSFTTRQSFGAISSVYTGFPRSSSIAMKVPGIEAI